MKSWALALILLTMTILALVVWSAYRTTPFGAAVTSPTGRYLAQLEATPCSELPIFGPYDLHLRVTTPSGKTILLQHIDERDLYDDFRHKGYTVLWKGSRTLKVSWTGRPPMLISFPGTY
ncbi:MAG: hypothetical protein C0478_10215 [Planctomyces sp.]|nr:hypothetical protein [Planctomyces sp.]